MDSSNFLIHYRIAHSSSSVSSEKMKSWNASLLTIITTLLIPHVLATDEYTIEEDEIMYHEVNNEDTRNKIESSFANHEDMIYSVEKEQNDFFNKTKNQIRNLAWYPGNPRAVWFISYPESGVPYFLHLIHASTGRSTATNYGHLLMRRDGSFYGSNDPSVEIYENGPVYYAPYLIKKMPNVAVRTHATGYCLFCHPKQYYYGGGSKNFFWMSAYGTKIGPKKTRVKMQYNAEQVKKMIHLIRDPYDTVVDRFFSYVNLKPASKGRYSLDATGFRLWCKDQNDTFEVADMAWLPAKLRSFAKDVPCRQEFVKYALFHSNVWKMSRFQGIDRLNVKYDDYFYNLEATVDRVNSYLELKPLPNVVLPKKLKRPLWEYSNYYTLAERDLIERLLRNMVTPSVWPFIRDYTPRYVLGEIKK